MNIVETIKSRAPLTNGKYVAAIADTPKPCVVAGRDYQTVSFAFKVMEGPAKDRLASVAMFLAAKNNARRVDHDAIVLSDWCVALEIVGAMHAIIHAHPDLNAERAGKYTPQWLRREVMRLGAKDAASAARTDEIRRRLFPTMDLAQ
jgi:hypothetical protein